MSTEESRVQGEIMKKSVNLTSCRAIGKATAPVWFTATDTVNRPEVLLDYQELLDDNERRRYASFRFPADQHLYLVAHALLRTSLSRYADVAPQEWRFSRQDGERPEILHGPDPESQLRFSLSHTPGLAACIIAEDVDVGVDVETLNREVDAMSIGNRYFSRFESRDLAGLSGCARQTRFLEYWTLKEAYLKACGRGLSIPMNDFSFACDDNGVWRIGFFSDAHSTPDAWQFLCVRPTPDHVMSVAIRRLDRQPFEIPTRETVPLDGMFTAQRRSGGGI
ncbi:MAG: 4'-phosphopantetheinyl transferase superfamily protein [Planctomycetota bacterium]|nr:4'-phosphopantetheinyl transferase superfamily protein [Planctomycetota bacterium]